MSGKKFSFEGLKSEAPINITDENQTPTPNPRSSKKKTPIKKSVGRPEDPTKKPTIQTSIRLHPKLKKVVKRIAEIKGVEVYSVYNEMIADYLTKYQKKYPAFFDHFEIPDKKEL